MFFSMCVIIILNYEYVCNIIKRRLDLEDFKNKNLRYICEIYEMSFRFERFRDNKFKNILLKHI